MAGQHPETDLSKIAEAGNWALVDNLCRQEIENGDGQGFHWYWLAKTALAIGAHDHAQKFLARASELAPGDERIRDLLSDFPHLGRLRAAQRIEPRYLVIREFGGGFWADVLSTLGYLHVAEYTGRIPVTFWGPASRFSDDFKQDAFRNFFEPVSAAEMHDIPGRLAGIFPERWSQIPIAASRPRDSRLGWKPVYLPELLFRQEQLIVGDFFGWPVELFAWTQDWDRIVPGQIEALIRRLWQKHIRPRKEIQARADRIWRDFGAPDNVVAVHVRATDKAFETAQIKTFLRQEIARIDALLKSDERMQVFVLTDSERLLTQYQRQFGDRVLSAPVRRSTDGTGVHFTEVESRHELGVDVLIDVLLACRCERFIGLASSNVSQAVRFMKDWAPQQIELLGNDYYSRRHPMMHDPNWQKAQHKAKLAGRT